MNCQLPPGTEATCWPGLTRTGNVFIDNRTAGSKQNDPPLTSRYPNNSIVADNGSVGWTDPSSGNYRLASGSPFKNKASDGKDPGVDMDALLAALGGVDNTPPASRLPHRSRELASPGPRFRYLQPLPITWEWWESSSSWMA